MKKKSANEKSVPCVDLHRRTMQEARADKAGPFEYRATEKTSDELLRAWTPAEILADAESDVLSRLGDMGCTPLTAGGLLCFEDSQHGSTEPDPDNPSHVSRLGIQLACTIRDIRRRLDAGGVTPEIAVAMFTAGRSLEAWRMMPFNRSAAGRLRADNKDRLNAKWEPILSEGWKREQRALEAGYTQTGARGQALRYIEKESGCRPTPKSKSKTANRRYSAWLKANGKED